MRILLHTCCACCTIEPFDWLRSQGHDVVGYFYNPNIHPLIEFRRRLKACKVLQERLPIPMIYNEDYGLESWLGAVDHQQGRCEQCYRMRLERTARVAAGRGFDSFTTTLLSSTHQDHDVVRRVGEEAAEAAGVGFHYADWRSLSERSHERARQMNLYLQSYCGCVFSEAERFRDTGRHLYRGPGPKADAEIEGSDS